MYVFVSQHLTFTHSKTDSIPSMELSEQHTNTFTCGCGQKFLNVSLAFVERVNSGNI